MQAKAAGRRRRAKAQGQARPPQSVTASTPMMMAPGTLRTASPAMSRKPAARKPCLRLRQIAEGDQRGRIVGDDAGIFERDQRQEKSDAGGDAEFQTHRNGVDQPGAQWRQRQGKEQQPGDEHAAERELPIAAELRHHGEGKIGVEPHARGERDGVIGVKPHDEGACRRGQAGGDEHGAMVHARPSPGSPG